MARTCQGNAQAALEVPAGRRDAVTTIVSCGARSTASMITLGRSLPPFDGEFQSSERHIEHQRAEQRRGRPAGVRRNGASADQRQCCFQCRRRPRIPTANKTGDYTVLRDLGAPAFQTNNAARLAEVFAAQRRDKLDLSGVAALDPQLSLLPEIEPKRTGRGTIGTRISIGGSSIAWPIPIPAVASWRIGRSAVDGATWAARSGSTCSASWRILASTIFAATLPRACGGKACGERPIVIFC